MIKFFTEADNQEIKDFLFKENGHLLQSFEWGNLRESEGHKVVRVGLTNEADPQQIKAYCQIVFHKLPKWYPSKHKYVGEVWRGPVLGENITEKEFLGFITAIREAGVANNAVFIKMEPKILQGSKFEAWFKERMVSGEESFIPCTSILNLERSEDELFASFDKYTRKNINKAIRKGVVVNIFTEPVPQKEAMKRAFALMQTTSERAGFRIRSSKFYENLIEIQTNNIKVHIIEAKVGKAVAASYITMTMNNTIYTPYSGSSREFSEYKANDLINWELIKYAKSIGIKNYDQWGVLPEDAPAHDPMWGVTNFKLGFNGRRERYIGAFDLVVSKGDYKLFVFAWNVRKLYKNIKGK